MTSRYMPKTLAKTLTYIAFHSPCEYGLFWDQNGTMPWKELYWVLQDDPSLRFVRESHIRELSYLGMELPFSLDGKSLRLRSGIAVPTYPVPHDLPARLYYGCRRKHYAFVREHGLATSGRPYLPLCSEREMALKLGRRRDADPILIEVLAKEASSAGISVREAGCGLYLVESVPVRYLICPPVRDEERSQVSSKGKKEKKVGKAAPSPTPGSFYVDARHFQQAAPAEGPREKAARRGKREAEWKRESRKDRKKRTV